MKLIEKLAKEWTESEQMRALSGPTNCPIVSDAFEAGFRKARELLAKEWEKTAAREALWREGISVEQCRRNAMICLSLGEEEMKE